MHPAIGSYPKYRTDTYSFHHYFSIYASFHSPIMIVLIRKNEQEHNTMDIESRSEQPQCRLLTLPAELRNHIWQYLLVQCLQSSPLPAHLFPGAPEAARRRTRFCANVLQTCKAINAEGTPILYGENIFLAHPSLLTALPSFLLLKNPNRVKLPPVLTPRVSKYIRRYFIHVRLDIDPRFSKSQVEESFTGVEELEVEVFQAMYGSCDFSNLQFFEGVRGVGRAVVHGSVGDGRYADWLARTMEQPQGSEATPFSEEYIGGNMAWDAWTHGNR